MVALSYMKIELLLYNLLVSCCNLHFIQKYVNFSVDMCRNFSISNAWFLLFIVVTENLRLILCKKNIWLPPVSSSVWKPSFSNVAVECFLKTVIDWCDWEKYSARWPRNNIQMTSSLPPKARVNRDWICQRRLWHVVPFASKSVYLLTGSIVNNTWPP